VTMQLRTEYKACPAKAICKDIGKLPDGTEKHSDYKGVLCPFFNNHGCSVCISSCAFFSGTCSKVDEDFLEMSRRCFDSTEIPDVHGGDIETTTIDEFCPDFVKTAIAHNLSPVQLPSDRAMDWLLGGKRENLSGNGY
jgi:hypothetical protein